MIHIAILDFGSQYTHLLARRIRELEVLAKIYPSDIRADKLPADAVGVILSGGPQSVYDATAPQIDKNILYSGRPVLGVCYGHQLMAQALGGGVKAGTVREYGQAQFKKTEKTSLLEDIKSESTVWMSHGDTVKELPNGFKAVGSTPDCLNAAMADEKRKLFGLQFHPEVHHTSQGTAIIKNFVLNICRAEQNWKIENIIGGLAVKIKKQVKGRKVFVLVSGGVDSSVTFALLTKALGEQKVKGLYIDTGFMRANESAEIKKNFNKIGFRNLETFDAGDIFFERLKNISEPEEKRKIIGQTFLDIKEKVAGELGLNPEEWLLGQGTIYPDTIETGGTKHADTIKTHHNRIDALQKMAAAGLVVEPLVDFYKDEVRQIGELLDLPKEMVERHPFPGPGLAIRCLCHASAGKPNLQTPPSDTEQLQKICRQHNIQFQILPIKSVGVQGDNRTYAHPAVIWGENNWNRLNKISTQITNSVKEVNRVLLRLLPKNVPKECRLHETCLTPERIRLLQKIDAIVNRIISASGLYGEIWQFPVVLIPYGAADRPESVVLRPIISREAMTANFARLDNEVVNKIVEEISATDKISNIFYDITNKPPGTIEWE
ncbi:glutamine-hydrolyzing GMP synthase [Candidatus Falkowbacteria bacterium CG10_big_fil_rev_8_21_14_0_10_43_10]|uniref:GMP synthase (glutamine-hydrolyzing) n=1 Tax=Candidatus Falkowbacteria bacterium CG10_big_fil_rev_8_21_14_0_10_43_10 TaxID=1974567 RepID=A0A2H0V212_9BACT|nr:MAG: glutamine-hydrolyzing GMP synthase [Candidatus Falkowbacteria bacterium CG10_big_fil_rev_8_21_14_0_10_43_10]